MAPGIQLEPETFYQLKNSYGFYLDGTDFEGNHDFATLLPWGTQFSHTFLIPVYKHFFQTSKGVLYFVILKCSLSYISYKLCVIVILSYTRWSILWK